MNTFIVDKILSYEEEFMERREAFRRWLQTEKNKKTGKAIPEKTIESYMKGIHKISDEMYETGIISKRLYSMKDIEEVNEAVAKIKKQHTYLSLNEKSDNNLHKALNYYTKFIESINEK